MSEVAEPGTPVPEVPGSGTERVALTSAAAELLVKLSALHGPLMFHQSGGCCDGSAPMCYRTAISSSAVRTCTSAT